MENRDEMENKNLRALEKLGRFPETFSGNVPIFLLPSCSGSFVLEYKREKFIELLIFSLIVFGIFTPHLLYYFPIV